MSVSPLLRQPSSIRTVHQAKMSAQQVRSLAQLNDDDPFATQPSPPPIQYTTVDAAAEQQRGDYLKSRVLTRKRAGSDEKYDPEPAQSSHRQLGIGHDENDNSNLAPPPQRSQPLLPLPQIESKCSVWTRTKNFFSRVFFTKTGTVGTGAVVAGSLTLVLVSAIPFVGQVVLISAIAIGGLFLLRRLYKWCTTPLFHSKIQNAFSTHIKTISQSLPIGQGMTESDEHVLSGIVAHIQNKSLDISKPLLIKKSDHNCNHSFLLYKNEAENICIIVKPNIKNKDSKDFGTYKTIKRSGIEIELSKDLLNYSVQKIVTCSKSRPKEDEYGQLLKRPNKDGALKNELGADLIQEGFKEIHF